MSKLLVFAKLLLLVLGYLFSRNSAERKRKEEAIEQICKGIDDNDTSAITSGFDSVHK
jgi:hypothetical protein